MMSKEGSEMNALVLVCGNVFDGISDSLTGPAEILVKENMIAEIGHSVERPPGARVIDLSERTVSHGFIDTHVHLTIDASNLAIQTLQSSAAKAVKGLNIAREYMNYGFTNLRDLGSVDPEWPTVDLRIGPGSGAGLGAAGGSALQPDEVRAFVRRLQGRLPEEASYRGA